MANSPNIPGTGAGFPLFFRHESNLLSSSLDDGRSAFAGDTGRLYCRSNGAWEQILTSANGGGAQLDGNNVWTGTNEFQTSDFKVNASGTAPPFPPQTEAMISSTVFSSSSAGLAVMSGSAGESLIHLGDSANSTSTILKHISSLNASALLVDANVKMTVNANGLNFGDGSLNAPGQTVKVSSTTGTFIVPSMNETQRDALPAGGSQNGAMLFNESSEKLNFRQDGLWVELAQGDATLAGNNTWTGTNQFQDDVSVTSGAEFRVTVSGTPFAMPAIADVIIQDSANASDNTGIALVPGTSGSATYGITNTSGILRGGVQYRIGDEQNVLIASGQSIVFVELNQILLNFSGSEAVSPASGTNLIVQNSQNAADDSGIDIENGASGTGSIAFSDTNTKGQGRIAYDHSTDTLTTTVPSGPPLIMDSNGIGIGNAAGPGQALNISSTTGALVCPRMTTAQQNALGSAGVGSIIYNTDGFRHRMRDQIRSNGSTSTRWAYVGQARYNYIQRLDYAAATSFTFSNLVGDTEDEYEMVMEGTFLGTSTTAKIYVRPNADTISGYASMLTKNDNLTVTSQSDTAGMLIMQKTANGTMEFYCTVKVRSNTLQVRHYSSRCIAKKEAASTALIFDGGGFWDQSGPSVTSLEVIIVGANATFNGSAYLYARYN